MKNSTKWLAYNELAWTEHIIAPPDDYAEETEPLINAIKEYSKNRSKNATTQVSIKNIILFRLENR